MRSSERNDLSEPQTKAWRLKKSLKRLNHRNPKVRCKAVTELARSGSTSVVKPLIITLQTDSSTEVKQAAIEALTAIGDKRAVGPLQEILEKRPSSTLVEAAGVALVRLGDPTTFPVLEKALHSPIKSRYYHNWSIPIKMVEAMEETGNIDYVELLIRSIDHEDPETRSSVIGTLGALKDRRAVEPIINRLGDQDSFSYLHGSIEVYFVAAVALKRIGDPKAIGPLLIQMMNEKTGWLDKLMWNLADFGTPALDQLVAGLSKWGEKEKVRIARCLSHFPDEQAGIELEKMCDDESKRVREIAFESLELWKKRKSKSHFDLI